jgi:hypothetical protein
MKSEWDSVAGINYLTELKLYEVSFVTLPMNPKAKITSFKSEDLSEIKSVRDVESILKDAGFSSTVAKTLISKIKEFSNQESRDAAIEEESKKAACDAESDLEMFQSIKETIQGVLLKEILLSGFNHQ